MASQPNGFRPASSTAPRRKFRRSAARRAAPAVLLLWAACWLPALSAPAQGLTPIIKLEATLKYNGPVRAVAINADESLIAAAAGAQGRTIIITDRRSKAVLGKIATEAGDGPRLVFSPVGDLLLVAGSEALELWEVPIAPLQPGRPLPAKHLRWRVPVNEKAPLGSAAFGSSPGTVVWTAGDGIFRRSTRSGSAYSAKPARTFPSGEGALAVSAGAGGTHLAVRRAGEKFLTLLDPQTLKDQGTLSGHRFPVVSAGFTRGKALVSLDSGYNVIRWTEGRQPKFVNYLQPPDSSLPPRRVLPIAAPHYLVVAGSPQEASAIVYNARKKKVGAVLKSVDPGTIAVSPTGRYILAGKEGELRLFGFARPLAPRRYVNHLKSLGAHSTARAYANHLDEAGLPRNMKAHLLAQLERGPERVGLEDFLNSLAAAEEEGNLEQMSYWANKVLAAEENHPEAVAALNRVREIRDERVISQAGKALELGEHRQAIAMLSSQVPADSPRYSEALDMIHRAERARAIETALEQAREKMNLGNFDAAEALVSEVLRKEGSHEAALDLEAEIAGRQSSINFEPLTFLFLALLAVSLVGGALFKARRWLAPFTRRFSLNEPGAGWGHAQARSQGAAPESPRRPPPRPATRSREAPPRPSEAQRELRREVAGLLEKAEEMIRSGRQADVGQRHSAFLLELEAELSTMRRRVTERTGDLPAMRSRLEEMMARLRKLKFGKAAPAAAPDGDATYYDVLKLEQGAGADQIKAAYHRLLKEYHPDLHSASSFGWVKAEAEKMSKKLSEAYEVLSDTSRREQYNRSLEKKRS